jgi:hypothetical protein
MIYYRTLPIPTVVVVLIRFLAVLIAAGLKSQEFLPLCLCSSKHHSRTPQIHLETTPTLPSTQRFHGRIDVVTAATLLDAHAVVSEALR